MKNKNFRKFLIKTVGILTLILITVTCVEAAMKFMGEYRYVGFEKKEGSWYGIAAQAQAYNDSCQRELEKANEQLEQFRKQRDEANEDILK